MYYTVVFGIQNLVVISFYLSNFGNFINFKTCKKICSINSQELDKLMANFKKKFQQVFKGKVTKN